MRTQPPCPPDAGVAEVDRLTARTFLAALPRPAPFVAAVLTGRAAAGMGATAVPDVELYVVLPTAAEAAALPAGRHCHAGSRITLVTLSAAELEAHVRHVERPPSAAPGRTRPPDDEAGRWRSIVRLALGETLESDARGDGLLRRLDRGLIRRALTAIRAGRLAESMLDTVDALESGDLLTAFAASEEAVRDGAEAMLAAFGDLPVEPSFLWRRMCRHEYLRDLLRRQADELFGLAALRGDEAEAAGVTRHRLWLAAHLAGQALLHGWDSVLVEPVPFRLRGDGPVRSPYTCLLRAEDGFRLTGPDAEVELSTEDAVLWSLLDGRPPAKVISQLARWTGTQPDRITWRIRRTLVTWEDEGLVLTDASDLHPAVAGRLPPSL